MGVDDGGQDLYNVFVWEGGGWFHVRTGMTPNCDEAWELVQRYRTRGKIATMRLIGEDDPPPPSPA
jgi:hypothetical protein